MLYKITKDVNREREKNINSLNRKLPLWIVKSAQSSDRCVWGNMHRFCQSIVLCLFSYVVYLEIFQVFVWLWLVNFIIGLGQMTLAGAFGSYYWAFDKSRDVPTFPVSLSLARCVRYINNVHFQPFLYAPFLVICSPCGRLPWFEPLTEGSSQRHLHPGHSSSYHIIPAFFCCVILIGFGIEPFRFFRFRCLPFEHFKSLHINRLFFLCFCILIFDGRAQKKI